MKSARDAYRPMNALSATLVVALFLEVMVESLRRVLGRPQAYYNGPLNWYFPGDGLDLAQGVLVTFLVIGFCAFAYRASRNLRLFGAGLATHPHLAWLYFLIPVANLVKPFDVWKELWQASASPDDARVTWQSTPVPAFLPLWWWTFVGSVGLGLVASVVSIQAGSVPSARPRVTALQLILGLLEVAAVVFASKTVRGLAAIQDARQRARVAAPPLDP